MAPKGDVTTAEHRLVHYLQAVQRAEDQTSQAAQATTQTAQSTTNIPVDPDSILAKAKALKTSLRKAITAVRLDQGVEDDSNDGDALVKLPADKSKLGIAAASMSEGQIAAYRAKQKMVKDGARMRLLLYQRMAEFHAVREATSSALAVSAEPAEEGEDDWKALVGLDD